MKPSILSAIKVMAVLGSLTLAGCAGVSADLQAGKNARRTGDYETAVKNLQPLADFGMPEARYELALAQAGRKDATPAEIQQAQELLIGLARDGHPEANFELARQYEHAKQPAEAKEYYVRAAELGNKRAYFQLGVMAEKEKDFTTAMGLYKRAYDSQYYRAAERIARLYEKGQGQNIDLNAALDWYKKAQENGSSGLETKIAELEAKTGS